MNSTQAKFLALPFTLLLGLLMGSCQNPEVASTDAATPERVVEIFQAPG
jgi:hypothetical protein